MLTMKRIFLSVISLFFFSAITGCTHLNAFFAPKSVNYSIVKVNSEKKYLQLISRTRGVLGTSNWGKFNYDVVQLPYEDQGEYFSVLWKRSGGEKALNQNVVCRIDFKHVDGKVSSIEQVFENPKKGKHWFIFENTGDLFVDYGEIELWKVSLIVNDQVVAEESSDLWWTVAKTKS